MAVSFQITYEHLSNYNTSMANSKLVRVVHSEACIIAVSRSDSDSGYLGARENLLSFMT